MWGNARLVRVDPRQPGSEGAGGHRCGLHSARPAPRTANRDSAKRRCGPPDGDFPRGPRPRRTAEHRLQEGLFDSHGRRRSTRRLFGCCGHGCPAGAAQRREPARPRRSRRGGGQCQRAVGRRLPAHQRPRRRRREGGHSCPHRRNGIRRRRHRPGPAVRPGRPQVPGCAAAPGAPRRCGDAASGPARGRARQSPRPGRHRHAPASSPGWAARCPPVAEGWSTR